MSKDKGIFEPQEGFAAPPKSPFAADDLEENPFATPSAGNPSPFSEVSDGPAGGGGSGSSPFGYAAPELEAGASPFGEAPTLSRTEPSAAKPEVSPFGLAEETGPPPLAATGTGPSEAPPRGEPNPLARSTESALSSEPESSSIRQLELRAIFGVDRELTEPEILQRSRSLPGIRQLARVSSTDAGAVESMKRLVRGLGFGDGQVKLYCGNAPLDFVREGPVMLAVQTDGGFAPGVRETLIIVARELAKL